MATITVLTAARMLAIEAKSVVSGLVDAAGHLILTKYDGSTVDAGYVKGPAGNNGTPGSKWISGTVAPASGTGVIGDFYINTATSDYYEKTGTTTWTLRGNLKGAQGTAGNPLASWPVGSIFMAVVATDPAVLLGGGTWVRWGAGRVPVSLDSTQVEFDTVEEIGGEKAHALTAAEGATHTHGLGTLATVGAGNHSHDVARRTSAGAAGGVAQGGGTLSADGAQATDRNPADHTHGLTGALANSGSGTAHNNLPPYIVAYFWKRTA